MRVRELLLGLSGSLLAGCMTLGPDYESPAPSAPAQEPFRGAASPAFTAGEPPAHWWALYRDPVLDGLIAEALDANTDLRVAAANLARARAALREVRTGRAPIARVSGGMTYGEEIDESDAEASFDAGLDVSYQLDLFGRIRRAIEASRADLGAVQAALDVTRISVAAETARAYADACGSGRRLAVARESLRIQSQTFDLTRRLFEGGRATALDTGRAGALLEQTRSAIPLLQAERESALYRLSVLIGRPPAQFPQVVAQCAAPPMLDDPVPVGDGAALLARRPDIRQAERELAAATARIGVATAELFPDVSLGLSAGTSAASLGDLGSGFTYSLGPLISWTIPTVSAARARIGRAEAEAQAALARFDGTWLRALGETESALSRYANGLDRVAALGRAVGNGREAARIARLRYQAGRESFQIVLDAERTLAETEAALAEAEAQLSDDLISLFLALGGGWQGQPV